MEPQELTNEKNELFESFKSFASRRAKQSTITFVIFCVLAGLCLFSAVIGYMNWITCIVCCIVFLIAGSYGIFWYPKLAKADDAQEFLTIYDKKRKIEKWKTLTQSLLIIAFIIILVIFKVDTETIIFWGGILVAGMLPIIFWKYPYIKDIDRLRELVQQS